jgi:hypothetical protein
MDNLESLIWETITRSAKTRFDFNAFEKQLNSPKENTIDCFLYTIISSFANEEPKKEIVTKVLKKTLQKQVKWEAFDIIRFVDKAEQLFKAEIYTAGVVQLMNKDHKDVKEVLTTVERMLY